MLKTVSTQLALASDTLPEVLAKGNTTGGTDLAVSSGDDITFADNSKAIFGAGSDLSIYSDGATGRVTGSVSVTGTVTANAGSFTTFTSTGIDDNATATAVTIDSANRLNIGKTASVSGAPIELQANTSGQSVNLYGRASDGVSYLGFFANGANTQYASIRSSNASDLILRTNGFNRLTISSTGAATFSDNVIIGTSGKGIDFSATAGTGTSELLDDYEEGTWTSLVGGTATYGANSARYTKIGRQVMASFDLNITLIGTGSTSTITGLPFATGDSIAEGVSVNFFDGLASSVVELNAYVINSEIRFRSLTAAGTGLSDVAVLGDSCRVTGTAIYTV